jgi:hypothetical protein
MGGSLKIKENKTMENQKLLEDIQRTLFGHNVRVGKDEHEKTRAAMCKLFVPSYDTGGVPAFKGLREAYEFMTGDLEMRGLWNPNRISQDLRSCMDYHSASFSYALQNALSIYLSKSYKQFPYREEILISDKKNAKDFRQIHSVQLGYFGDLPDVDPEAGDYVSIAQYQDTEATYSLSPKGAVIWVTRKHIINDAIGLVQDMVKRLSRAARMTHAKFIWNFFKNNATCPDGTGWFTLAHGNLGTNALDYSSLATAVTALANMTEPTPSSQKIGLDLETFKWIALWELAVQKNQGKSYYTSNDLTSKTINACYRLFGDRNERIVTCPFLTDADDWGVIRDKEDVPIVEMSYLNGREDPEFILAEAPDNEHVLIADKLGYKVRHEYGGVLAGYRGGYKATV